MTATYDLSRGFTIARTINATPADVFRAWTDPDHLGWFFNPAMPLPGPAEVDLRPGGAWRLEMVINSELDYVTGGIYREIRASSLLSFYWGAVGGWPELAPTDAGQTGTEDALLATITLSADGPPTEQLFRLALPDHFSESQVAEWLGRGIHPGWTDTIDRLVAQFAQGAPQLAARATSALSVAALASFSSVSAYDVGQSPPSSSRFAVELNPNVE